MQIQVVQGAIQEVPADAIIVNLFEGAEPGGAAHAVDASLGGAVRELIAAGDFTGKAGQIAVLYPRGGIPARRVILVGLGPQADFTLDSVRRAAAAAIVRARELGVRHAASILHGAGAGGLAIEAAAEAIAEGSLLALYTYHGLRTAPPPEALPERLDLVIFDAQDERAAQGVRAGEAIAAGVRLARDLVNQPPNLCTPVALAQAAVALAQAVGLKAEVLEKGQIEALRMGALLGVAQGSSTPPRFIILEHRPEGAVGAPIVLVGKGVTFDTGGYSLKSFENMGTMKADMAGGAAVIGAMSAIARLNLPLPVVGLVPAADNMISGHAYRPQEVLTASNGVTIEIISTDAEGRLLLADALAFAARYQPAAVVDIATLTGSCVIALGEHVAAGLFSTDDALRDALMRAADQTAEKLWPLPLFPEYDQAIESQVADIKNSGGRLGGVGTSAAFLKRFTSYPWAHIDMAGMNLDTPDNPYVPSKGATGYGVRLLTAFVRGWQPAGAA